MPIKVKLLVFSLGIIFCCVNDTYAQRIIPDEKVINYSTEETPFRDVLFELSEKSDVVIAFQDQIIPADSLVSLSIRKQRLGKIIDYLIKPHNLKYKIIGDQIVIVQDEYKKPPQEKSDFVVLSGTIRDKETGETMVSANVYLDNDPSRGTSSNEYGFYSFRIERGLHLIRSSYVGYQDRLVEMSLTKDTIVDIELDPMTRLKEIIVSEKTLIPIKDTEQQEIASLDFFPIERLKAQLPLAGEPDILRLAYSSTGVTSGADGFGGMSVRGGETNQNLVLFDGIPVYNAQHGFGLFSIFNSNVIKSATLYKGAYPSHYSGRLSSVIDIRTREGSLRKFRGDVAIGLFTASAALEGPIIKEKSSYLISARRTFVDPWIRQATNTINDGNGGSFLYFLDFNAKVNFQIARNSKLYLSYYTGNDHFDSDVIDTNPDTDAFAIDYDNTFWDSGNTLLSLRWNSRLSHSLFLNASVYTSQYSLESFEHSRIEYYESEQRQNLTDVFFDAGYYLTGINDLGFKAIFDFIPNTNHKIKFGAGYLTHKFTPGFTTITQGDSLVAPEVVLRIDDAKNKLADTDFSSSEMEFFIEDEIKIGEKTRLNLGYNHTIINTGEQSYQIPQPRMMLTVGTKKSHFKASAGRMGQFLHTLTNTGLGIPIDVWLPSTDQIAPETSVIYTAGQFKESKIGQIGIEGFFKKYQNLTRFSETGFVDITAESDWESLVPIGTGESYGAEFSIDKRDSKFNYKLGYTLSWSNRQYDEINNGEKFAFRYDRRHVVNLNLIYKLSESFDISANWEYGSGTPITLPNNQAYIDPSDGSEITVLIYDEINNAQLPDYHRLDFGVNIYNTHKWGSSTLTLGLYNAYNRQNPFYRDVKFDPRSIQQLEFQDITIIPVLPTFRYAISF